MKHADTTVLCCVGNSQWPILKHNCFVEVAPITASYVREGDLVIFHAGSILVGHRVIQRKESAGKHFFLTKGDSVLKTDGWFSSDSLIGKVVRVNQRSIDTFPMNAVSS